MEAGKWKDSPTDVRHSVHYKLTHELRRLERTGRGSTEYATAIRQVLQALAADDVEGLADLIEHELERCRDGASDEPYAHALRVILGEINTSDEEARRLLRYYLRRLERQGRGDEPFADALRSALNSGDASSLASMLYLRAEENR